MRFYVNSFKDMCRHVNKHRARVYALGLFAAIHPSFIVKFVLKIHDIEKYLYMPWLWKYYGNKGNKIKAQKLYQQMNKVGKVLQSFLLLPMRFFFLKEEIQYALLIERIVDVVDRNSDPVALEEFDLLIQNPMSNYLMGAELYLGSSIKAEWKNLTKHLQFRK